jgi:transposase
MSQWDKYMTKALAHPAEPDPDDAYHQFLSLPTGEDGIPADVPFESETWDKIWKAEAKFGDRMRMGGATKDFSKRETRKL